MTAFFSSGWRGMSTIEDLERGVTDRLLVRPAGEALMSEGDFGHALFLIETGTADVSVHGEKVAVVGPGDIVGEAAVLVSGRRTASVVATAPVRAIAFFKRDVWGLERAAPAAARRLRAAFDERAGTATRS